MFFFKCLSVIAGPVSTCKVYRVCLPTFSVYGYSFDVACTISGQNLGYIGSLGANRVYLPYVTVET